MQYIDKDNIPRHIAIIMDGNGRWAKKRFLPRSAGHKEGLKAVERVLKASGEIGVKFLTLYAFSMENWNRPKEEVSALMNLLITALDKQKDKFNDNNISLKIIGDYQSFSQNIVERLENTIQSTSNNNGIILTLALNYSGRWEITNMIRKLAEKIEYGDVGVNAIDEQYVSKALATNFMPDPDLLIRTSGELRISNFLLWQVAYSEMYFTDELWPDFNEQSLIKAIISYQRRERRFGSLKK